MSSIADKARAARAASLTLGTLATNEKNAVLLDLAESLEANCDPILAANARDMDNASPAGLTAAKLKRLELTAAGVAQMADGLRQIATLPDPVGDVVKEYETGSGLRVRKVRVPLGVIAMIYEARPNVTIDAFSLCFKAGNACLLKGGREAAHSNTILADLAANALRARGLAESSIEMITTSDRDEMREMLAMSDCIHLVIPRGGTELIRFVHEHSRIPTVQHFHGVCHIYVDEHADRDMALDICVSAKTSAPATCNAAECILVHESRAADLVPDLVERYRQAGVEVRGDAKVAKLAPGVTPARSADWGREFLDLVVAVKVVESIHDAVEHIHEYGSNHTDAIVSADESRQTEFIERVGSSCVLTNASTRFNDGFQLGLGAEIGISTSRIHAYGPMGLEELTTQRYVVMGSGQVR